MDWHEGYVSGVDYTVEFFRDQAPMHLNVACIINGVEPPPPDQPYTYFELGCGQGLTTNVLAAANPHARFFAADFNPAHIAGAQDLADRAGLKNITLLENSFAELADGKVELPELDYITLHGVWTWVNRENREHVARFIERYLKPGGVLYISYNAMPGWAATLPLQRLLLEQNTLFAGDPGQKLQSARDLITALTRVNASYFCNDVSPILQQRIDIVQTPGDYQSQYLAHEYMNQGWEPLYHADVAAGLANCKVEYVGSASFSQAYPDLYLDADQQQLLASVLNPVSRETVKDYLCNTGFRRDVFVKGARHMSPMRQRAWFDRTAIVLTSMRETIAYSVQLAAGRVTFSAALFDAMLDALESGPKTHGQLLALPQLTDRGPAGVMEMMALLAESQHAQIYFVSATPPDCSTANAFNDALIEHGVTEGAYTVFAAPLVGSGVKNGMVQRLVFQGLRSGIAATDTGALVSHVEDTMNVQGVPIGEEGGVALTPARQREEVTSAVTAILERRVPIWKQLGVLQ